MTPDLVRRWIKEYLRRQPSFRRRDTEIADDANLVETGLLDSLGFVALIVAIEANYGLSLDLVNLPPEALVRLDLLADIVARALG